MATSSMWEFICRTDDAPATVVQDMSEVREMGAGREGEGKQGRTGQRVVVGEE